MKQAPRKTVKLADMKPAPYNPRKISQKAFDGLAATIDEFGLVQEIVWNQKTGNIVGGHQRYKVLLERGVKSTTVSVVDLSEDKEKQLNVALNNPHTQGEFNDSIDDLLEQISDNTSFESMLLDELMTPEFEPIKSETVSRLDQYSPMHVDCPNCGHSFDAKNA